MLHVHIHKKLRSSGICQQQFASRMKSTTTGEGSMGTTRTTGPSRVAALIEHQRRVGFEATAAPGRDPGAARLRLGNIELAALDTELAYRGPERRNGPAASPAQLL